MKTAIINTRRASQLLKFMKAFPMMIINIKKVPTKEGLNKENYLLRKKVLMEVKVYLTSSLLTDVDHRTNPVQKKCGEKPTNSLFLESALLTRWTDFGISYNTKAHDKDR